MTMPWCPDRDLVWLFFEVTNDVHDCSCRVNNMLWSANILPRTYADVITAEKATIESTVLCILLSGKAGSFVREGR